MKRLFVFTMFAVFLLNVATVQAKKVLDVGKIEITKDEKHTATWSPLWGVGIMVFGGALILFGKRT